MRQLAAGKFESYHAALVTRGNDIPDCAPGAPLLRLRSGKMLPRWDGERVSRLAVTFQDGHGDTFCFGRYLPGLRDRAEVVTAIMSRPAIPIVAPCVPEIQCVPLDDCSAELDAADAYVNAWALPWASGEGFGTAAWLSPKPERIAAWRQGDRGPHIGIAWGGSNWNQADGLRSIPVSRLSSLFRIGDVTWHSLQVGPKAGECPAGVRDYSDRIADFNDTAGIIAGLDLVISVDTAVANLAGAMAKPVWVLVERDNDFRWGLEGESSAWFPSARVFRQRSSGSWARVIRNVRAALASAFGAPGGRQAIV